MYISKYRSAKEILHLYSIITWQKTLKNNNIFIQIKSSFRCNLHWRGQCNIEYF